mmetsp:Transcript_150026/g.287376  ORF Transcript_150026/g.287376 Transcript_150026/m.287376 type:complete len:232 (+) Transcript_150026:176-871(+)
MDVVQILRGLDTEHRRGQQPHVQTREGPADHCSCLVSSHCIIACAWWLIVKEDTSHLCDLVLEDPIAEHDVQVPTLLHLGSILLHALGCQSHGAAKQLQQAVLLDGPLPVQDDDLGEQHHRAKDFHVVPLVPITLAFNVRQAYDNLLLRGHVPGTSQKREPATFSFTVTGFSLTIGLGWRAVVSEPGLRALTGACRSSGLREDVQGLEHGRHVDALGHWIHLVADSKGVAP